MESILAEKSFWTKTANELTVKDQVKLAGGIVIASVVVPFATLCLIGGVAKLAEKVQERRAQKKDQKSKKS